MSWSLTAFGDSPLPQYAITNRTRGAKEWNRLNGGPCLIATEICVQMQPDQDLAILCLNMMVHTPKQKNQPTAVSRETAGSEECDDYKTVLGL